MISEIILLQKGTSAAVDNMEGTLVASSSLVYGNINEGNISHTQEDPMILATSYMMYKMGESFHFLLNIVQESFF